MRPSVSIFAVCLALLNPRHISAQVPLPSLGGFATHHTRAKLILSAETAKPGDTVWAGVDLKMEPGWHTYWRNPGEAGSPTKIEWQLPAGVSAGEIQWPLPEKLPPAEVTTYGYEKEVVLLVPLTLASDLQSGALNLAAKLSWLECKETCIPADQNVEAKLNVGSETKSSADAATIQTWQATVPRSENGYSFQAWWGKSPSDDSRPLIINHGPAPSGKNVAYDSVDFFPDASDQFEFQSATEIISGQSAYLRLRKIVKKLSGDWPKEISGVVVVASGQERSGYEVKLPVAEKAPAGEAVSSTDQSPALPPQSLAKMLVFAFIGGLILNIMPCVLPVIALKILGFVSEARSEPRRVRMLGLIYALGVLVSFLALAGIVIGVKAAGHHAGWGMQFGSPVFVVCLTTLVTLVALNLFGVFEVTLGGRALDTAGQLASKHGAAGAFFNGVLATTLATPCTAPILANALGFAFAQNAPVIVLIFLFVGVGLAAPYVLLSWEPAWLKFLPKPGVWMEKFKIGMGFPILGTAIWLYALATGSMDKSRALWFGLFLIALALAAWIWGEFVQRGRRYRLISGIVSVLLAGGFGAYAYFLPPDQIHWQPWTPEAVAQARAAGKPVLVDFTADWCLTCQVNKKTSIEIPSVRKKISELGVVALLADDTHTPENISTELGKYARAGVPLVLVYPGKADAPPIVLPEVLTPGIVLSALDRAAKK